MKDEDEEKGDEVEEIVSFNNSEIKNFYELIQ